jgi:hypothetical protein
VRRTPLNLVLVVCAETSPALSVFICMHLSVESRNMHLCFNFTTQMFGTPWRDGQICNLFGHLQRVGVH